MEKTITLEMTESQAKKFEELFDDILEIFNRWEKENPEREARFQKHHEEFMKNIAETEKNMAETERLLAKWKASLEK
jgi:phenolic acid decarboxylase